MGVFIFFLSCSTGNGGSEESDSIESPGIVKELDRFRYNVNESDELVRESTLGRGSDTTDSTAREKMDTPVE